MQTDGADRSRIIELAREYASSRGWNWNPKKEEANFVPAENKWCVALGDDEEPFAESVWITMDGNSQRVEEVDYLPRLSNPIPKAKALEIAAVYANSQGWAWSSRLHAVPSWDYDRSGTRRHVWLFDLRVWSGTNTRVVIDAESGAVVTGYRAEM